MQQKNPNMIFKSYYNRSLFPAHRTNCCCAWLAAR